MAPLKRSRPDAISRQKWQYLYRTGDVRGYVMSRFLRLRIAAGASGGCGKGEIVQKRRVEAGCVFPGTDRPRAPVLRWLASRGIGQVK